MGDFVEMTLDQVVNLYEQKFGGVPWEIICGMPDNEIKETLAKSLETGEEVSFKHGVLY